MLENRWYIHMEHGYLVTYAEARDIFETEYDGNGPTNCIGFYDIFQPTQMEI